MSGASARERIRDRSEAEPQYERRRPEQTPLCRLVRAHYESFAANVERATGTGLLQFVIDEDPENHSQFEFSHSFGR